MKYTIEEFNTFYGLREVGREQILAKFSTRGEAQLFLDRMNNPKYPFSAAMQFCTDHSPDSDICDVIECEHCHIAK